MNIAHNKDCLEAMRNFPDKSFDLSVVDPPYFHGPENANYFGSDISKTGVRRGSRAVSSWNVPSNEYFKELDRISKRYIVWGCNYFDFVFSHGRIVWDKKNDSSTFSNCEIAATNLHESVKIFRYTWNGMLQEDMKNKEVRIHPTQKPVALYDWIFNNYAKPGDMILDTHLGSGSSRIAAYKSGLDFVGFEIDKDYFEAQEKRFQEYKAQVSFYEKGC